MKDEESKGRYGSLEAVQEAIFEEMQIYRNEVFRESHIYDLGSDVWRDHSGRVARSGEELKYILPVPIFTKKEEVS